MILYRYYDALSGRLVQIEIERFRVIKETPCGYWYIPDWMRAWPEEAQQQDKRWVSKEARVRRCYPTKDEAWQSYCARKRHQASHLQLAQRRLDAILALIEDVGTAAAPTPVHRTRGLIMPGSLFQLDL